MSDTQERARELLGNVLVELRRRTSDDSTSYDVIRSAGLLRLLICDQRKPTLLEDALVEDLGGLRFVIRTPLRGRMLGSGGSSGLSILARGLVPYDVETRTASVSLVDFRLVEAAQVALGGEDSVACTVDEVVKYAANVLGGVHYRQPKGRRERVTAALLESRSWRDLPWVLQDIAGVVLNALYEFEPGSPGIVLKVYEG